MTPYLCCFPIVIIPVFAVVISTKVIFTIAAKTDYRDKDFFKVMMIQISIIIGLALLMPVLRFRRSR